MRRLIGLVYLVALAMPVGRAVGMPVQGGAPAVVDSAVSSGELPLERRVTVRLRNVPLRRMLAEIDHQARLGLAYTSEVVPLERVVTLERSNVTAAAALREVLSGTAVVVEIAPDRRIALVKAGRTDTTATVHGRVSAAVSGLPIAGANVRVAGTALSAVTSDSGTFVIERVPRGTQSLIARRIGFLPLTKQVVVDSVPVQVDFALIAQATPLQDLVTTVTGQRRRLELGNDITSINADSLVRVEPIRNVTDLLDGRVPGLTLQRTSGAPGDPTRLRLRGAGSPRLSNDPIVIVDGIRIYAQQSSARSSNLAGIKGDSTLVGTSSYATPSPLDQIDPNSIETLEVLKGPSGATLYGQDAANGVIVITTKRGKAGPPRWSFSADYGQTRMAGQYPDLVARWGHSLTSNLKAGQVFCPITNIDINSESCEGDSVVTFQLLSDPATTVLGRGRRTETSLGVAGGTPALTYSINGRYTEEVGLPKLPDYEVARYQTRVGRAPPDWMRRPQRLTQWGATSNLSARLGTKANVSLTTSLERTVQQRSSLEQQLGTLMTTYLDQASGIYYTPTRFGFSSAGQSVVTGDLLTRYFERATSQSTTFRTGANLTWYTSALLTLSADAGLEVQQRADQIFLPFGANPDSINNNPNVAPPYFGHLNDGHGTTATSTLNLRGNLREIRLPVGARFRFATGLGFNGTSFRDQNFQTSRLAEGTTLPGSKIDGIYQGLGDQALFRWYAEPAVGFNGLWFTLALQLQQAGTTDGANTLGFLKNLKQQLKFPPTFNTSYVLSDQGFFPFKDLFQMFRVRAAFGRAGRQPGPTDRLRLYDVARLQPVDGGLAETEFLHTLGNTELRPERTTELEGGFDADLLNNTLSVGVTAYRKTTNDMILGVSVAPSVYGGDVIQRNIGNLRNTGLEVQVTARLLRSGPIGLETQVWVAQHRNVLLALAPGVEPFYSGDTRVAPGYPLFGRWTKPIVGYADGNRNEVLEPAEVVMGDTAIYVGQTDPNYTANIRTTVALFNRAVQVSAGFNYDDGLSQQNGVAAQFAPFSVGRNVPGASLAEQLASIGAPQTAVDYTAIQTVSTFRFNSLSVNYTVPQPLVRRLGAQALSVSVQGQNLGLWTNYRGLDPNVNAFATGNNVTDTGVLPQPRSWQLQINATY